MRKAKKAPVERTIQLPVERYGYFRDELRMATEARRELMEHLQALIQKETVRHQVAWDEIAVICGYKNYADIVAHDLEIVIDWKTIQIKLRSNPRKA